jgi:alpha-galactosidase
MAILLWAVGRSSKIKTVGLCHSVQGTAEELAHDIDVPVEEINYLCAGINHMAFYLTFERNGEDLYPRIRQVVEEGRVPAWNRVRYEILMRLGYFVTESSEHFAEYVPWFIKRDRPDLIGRFGIPLDEYIQRCEIQIKTWQFVKDKLERDINPSEEAISQALVGIEVSPPVLAHIRHQLHNLDSVARSHEYGSLIIHSLETGTPRLVYGNVRNDGLIDNLPPDCIVEVPCQVDKNGLQPIPVGGLPPHLAALMQTNINVQRLTVEAALTGKREHIYHAAMLDPHTAAELDLDQIWNLVDELIKAHGSWLPAFY